MIQVWNGWKYKMHAKKNIIGHWHWRPSLSLNFITSRLLFSSLTLFRLTPFLLGHLFKWWRLSCADPPLSFVEWTTGPWFSGRMGKLGSRPSWARPQRSRPPFPQPPSRRAPWRRRGKAFPGGKTHPLLRGPKAVVMTAGHWPWPVRLSRCGTRQGYCKRRRDWLVRAKLVPTLLLPVMSSRVVPRSRQESVQTFAPRAGWVTRL